MSTHNAPDPDTEVACARHPGTATRLHCSECGTPICPRCSVVTVVGQKCPTCARGSRAARRLGKPRQYVKAGAVGVAAAGVIGVVLFAFFASVGFLTLVSAGIAGYGVGAAVRLGAEGNGSQPFLVLAIVLSVLMIAGVWVIGYGILAPRTLGALSYLAAPYGASLRFR